MKLTILGTGNAVVTRCYNTCFIFDDNGKYFLSMEAAVTAFCAS